MRLPTVVQRESFIRFLTAVIGLGLSFTAAMLSSAAREDGNLLATAILASSALMLAGLVAALTVPYLAKQVAGARRREALDYQVTRGGLVYLGFILVVAVAALNTGNNLLFLIVSALLGAIVVSGVASARQLRRLEMQARIPDEAFAGSEYPAVLTLTNRSRWLPALSVVIGPAKQATGGKTWRWQRTTFEFPKAAPGRKPYVCWRDFKLERIARETEAPSILRQPVYFPYVRASSSATAELNLSFDRRGRYAQDAFGITTGFPFSFLIKTRRVQLRRELIVYPKVEPIQEFFEVLPLITGEFESYVRGRGHDLYRIRDYQPDDSARHVDWKASAKSSVLKVREFSREDERRLRIVFDNASPGAASVERYERGVSLAASFAWYFAQENASLSFSATGLEEGTLSDFLRYLALVEPGPQPSIMESLPMASDFNLVLTWRSRGTISTPVWQSSYVLFLND